MRKLILGMQVSLDGFVEGPNGAMDWLNYADEEQWQSMFDVLRSVDTLLLGRVMYPEYADYWRNLLRDPSSGSKYEVEYAQFADKTPHLVFSRTLEKADWENTRIIKGNIKDEVLKLKQKSGKNILLLGGAKLASAFINLELIDEYRLVINPVILGGGKSLFQNIDERKNLKLVESTTLKSGVIEVFYTTNKEEK